MAPFPKRQIISVVPHKVQGADVSVIATATNTVVATLTVGTDPEAATYDGANGNVYVPNSGSDNVSVISTLLEIGGASPEYRGLGATGTTVGTIGVKNGAWGLAYDGADGDLYVADYSSSEVSVVNDLSASVVATIAGLAHPYYDAVDSANGFVYVTDSSTNQTTIINAESNTVVGTISVGKQPVGITYDSANGDLYVVNDKSNNVSVVSGASNTVVATINVGTNPVQDAVDSANGNIYVTNVGSNNVSVIAGATNTVLGSVHVGSVPEGVAFDPANGDLYVTNSGSGNVTVINGATNHVAANLPVGSDPLGAVFDTANGDLYVSNDASGNLTVFDGATNLVVGSVPVGTNPLGVAYDAAYGILYTVNDNGGSAGSVSVTLTLAGATTPIESVLDLGQSLLLSAPVVGDGTGDLAMSILPSASAGLVCTADPIGVAVISGACVGTAIGTYTVTLSLTDSLGNTVETQITVRVLSIPTVSAPVATPAAVDVGQATELTTTANGGTRVYAFNWSGLPAGCVSADAVTIECTPTIAGNAFLNVTAVDSDGFPATAGPTELVVSADPAVGIPVAAPASVDVGESTMLSGSVTSPGSGSDIFAWAGLPAGCSSADLLTLLCTPSAPGLYSVVLSILDSNGVNVSSSPGTLVVAPAEGTPTVLASVPSLDVGQEVTFAASASGGTGVYSYFWTGLPTGCTSANSATLSCAPAGTGTFSVVVSTNDSDGVNTSSAPLSVTVSPSLGAPAVSASTTTLDVGQTVDLSATDSGGAGGDSFTWSGLPPGCASANAEKLACTPIAPPGAYSIVLAVEDSNGMKASSTPITLVVAPALARPLLAASEPSLDAGQSVAFTASTSGGSGSYTYTWTGLPSGCAGTNSATILCEPDAAGGASTTVSVTDSNGVELTSAPLAITVSPALGAPTVSASVSSLDVGQTVTLTATATGGSGGYAYSWSGAPAGCANSAASTLSCTPSGAGTATVVVHVRDSNSANVTSVPIALTVSPALSKPTVTASVPSVPVGATVVLTAEVAGGSGTYSYAWSGLPAGCSSADTATLACAPTSVTGSPFGVSVTVTDSNGVAATSPAIALAVTSPSSSTSSSGSGISSFDYALLAFAIVAVVLALLAVVLAGRRKGDSSPSGAAAAAGGTASASVSGPGSGTPSAPEAPGAEPWNEDVESPNPPPGQ